MSRPPDEIYLTTADAELGEMLRQSETTELQITIGTHASAWVVDRWRIISDRRGEKRFDVNLRRLEKL